MPYEYHTVLEVSGVWSVEWSVCRKARRQMSCDGKREVRVLVLVSAVCQINPAVNGNIGRMHRQRTLPYRLLE